MRKLVDILHIGMDDVEEEEEGEMKETNNQANTLRNVSSQPNKGHRFNHHPEDDSGDNLRTGRYSGRKEPGTKIMAH